MARANRMFILGAMFMGGLWVFSHALHWFITPSAYTASEARNVAVGAQALVGLALAGFALWRARRSGATAADR